MNTRSQNYNIWKLLNFKKNYTNPSSGILFSGINIYPVLRVLLMEVVNVILVDVQYMQFMWKLHKYVKVILNNYISVQHFGEVRK